ncbi:MFS general substrate transporter [Scleroderma citrinum]
MALSSRTPSVQAIPKSILDGPSVLAPSEVHEVPDEGLEAWCTLLGSFLGQFCAFGYSNSYGVYQDFYSRHYLSSESSSSISWIGSLNVFLINAVGPISGRLHDRGYFYPVFITGVVLQSLSLFMLSLAQPGCYYQVFLAQGLGSGMAQGLIHVPSYSILSHHFSRRRPLATAIVASGAPLGSIVHTIMLNRLLNGPVGFATGVRISAGFITVLLFVACLLVRPRYPPYHTSSVNVWKVTKRCIMGVPSLLMITGFLLFQTMLLYPFFYLQTDAIRHGLSTSFSFYSVVILNTGNFCGRLSVGFLTLFLGVIDLITFSTVACAVLLLGMVSLGSVSSFVVLGFLYGVFTGNCIALMPSVVSLLTENPAELGVRMGIRFLGSNQHSLRTGTPISGALLTRRYLWWAPVLFCAVNCRVPI